MLRGHQGKQQLPDGAGCAVRGLGLTVGPDSGEVRGPKDPLRSRYVWAKVGGRQPLREQSLDPLKHVKLLSLTILPVRRQP